MLHAHIDILITIQGEAEHQEIEDGTQQYRDDRQLLPRNIALQSGIAVKQPKNQEGQEPEETQHNHLQDTDNDQQGISGLTGKVLEERGVILIVRSILINIGFIKTITQFFQAILPTQVHLSFVPIIARIGDNVQEWCLSVYKDIAFQRPIARLGIVVGFLQAQISFLIMCAVGYHGSPVIGVHLQNLRGIEDTGITQRLAYRV